MHLMPKSEGKGGHHMPRGWAPYAQGWHHMPTKNTNKNKSKETTRSSGSKNPQLRLFSLAPTGASLNYPYESKRADFVRYNAWKKLDAGLTDDALFEKAVSNYLASPQGQYTFADLVHRFAVFRNSALDRFGKPVESRTPPPPVPSPPSPVGVTNACRGGFYQPVRVDTPGGVTVSNLRRKPA
jgi:hypothetical protein